MSSISTASSSHGGSSDEKSGSKPAPHPQKKPLSSSSSSSSTKVSTVRPEVVYVEKDHMTLLLAKCRNQERQIRSMKNLELVIRDAYSQLESEKKKSTKFQTALIFAENRVTDMVRVQLENAALQHQLPFLARVSRPVGKATRYPLTAIEEPLLQVHEKSKTDPMYEKSKTDHMAVDDLETDCPDATTMPSHPSSGYHSWGNSKAREHLLDTDGRNSNTTSLVSSSVTLTTEDYESMIDKQTLTIRQMKLQIKDLQNLLEAKSNSNMDALTAQLAEALRKNETLVTANKNKETLLQNYYAAYTSLTKQQQQQQQPAHACSASLDVASLENCSKDELQQMIRETRKASADLRDVHESKMVEQRGLFLKERENSCVLEAQLKACKESIDELRARPAMWSKSDFPLTMSELRERNQYLEETVKLHEHSRMKLSQEKERAVAALNLQLSELDKVKKERTQLEIQLRQMRQHATDPDNETNQLRRQLEAAVDSRLQQPHADCQGCRQTGELKNANEQWQKKCDLLQQHSDKQQKLILQLQGVHSEGSSTSTMTSGDSGVCDKSNMSTVEKMLECPRCYKEFTLDQVEKFQRHCGLCLDDD